MMVDDQPMAEAFFEPVNKSLEDTKERHLVSMTPVQASSSELLLEILLEVAFPSIVQPLEDPVSSCAFRAKIIGELLATVVEDTVSMTVPPLVRTNEGDTKDIIDLLEVLPEEPQPENVQPLDDPVSSQDYDAMVIGELLGTLVDDAVSMSVLPLVRTNDREPEDFSEILEVLPEEPQTSNVQPLDDPESSRDYDAMMIGELLGTLVDDAVSMSVLPLVRTNDREPEDLIELSEVLQEEPQPANVQPLVSSCDRKSNIISELLATLVDDAISMSVLPLVRTNDRDHVDTIELLEVLPEEPQPANVQPLDDPESSCDWKSNMISELLGTLVDDAVSISVLPLVRTNEREPEDLIELSEVLQEEQQTPAEGLGLKTSHGAAQKCAILLGLWMFLQHHSSQLSLVKTLLYSVKRWKGQPQLNISVLQTPVWGSVTPGESVTLQCTVLPDLRAAGLPVLWFRDAAGQSFPEIIYTPQKTGSHQCEFSSSTNSCMYNFSISNFSQSDAGTYYCAVAACGRIIVGNGVSVHFVYMYHHLLFLLTFVFPPSNTEIPYFLLGSAIRLMLDFFSVTVKRRPVDPIVFYLATALGICVTVICGLAIQICSVRQHNSVVENKISQNSAAVELNYAARSLRKKSGPSGDSVYSEVRYFTVTDPNNP
ncbi:hypothetical protein NFI96_005702 [Prochilodus magdalenae]|nr:hypothetical protein NFI96_005702 [Prochilodus magdalenae]